MHKKVTIISGTALILAYLVYQTLFAPKAFGITFIGYLLGAGIMSVHNIPFGIETLSKYLSNVLRFRPNGFKTKHFLYSFMILALLTITIHGIIWKEKGLSIDPINYIFTTLILFVLMGLIGFGLSFINTLTLGYVEINGRENIIAMLLLFLIDVGALALIFKINLIQNII